MQGLKGGSVPGWVPVCHLEDHATSPGPRSLSAAAEPRGPGCGAGHTSLLGGRGSVFEDGGWHGFIFRVKVSRFQDRRLDSPSHRRLKILLQTRLPCLDQFSSNPVNLWAIPRRSLSFCLSGPFKPESRQRLPRELLVVRTRYFLSFTEAHWVFG